jgi:hypothetical protein
MGFDISGYSGKLLHGEAIKCLKQTLKVIFTDKTQSVTIIVAEK